MQHKKVCGDQQVHQQNDRYFPGDALVPVELYAENDVKDGNGLSERVTGFYHWLKPLLITYMKRDNLEYDGGDIDE